MHPDSASLSSVATTIDDLTNRVTEVADRLQVGRQEGVAADLYEVERALQGARRRLAEVVRVLG
jgi:hypothetical protein